jgi:TolB-like protein/DNA-binding winged helix-turn-helix (wHTH) protein
MVMSSRRIQFGAFELDSTTGELRKHNTRIRLQEQPLQILQQLLERPGEVITKEELQKRIWPADTFVDFDHGLYSAVQRLRDTLGDTAETPRYIETLPRRGYRFIASVNNGSVGEPKAQVAMVEPPVVIVPEHHSPRVHALRLMLAGAGLALLTLLITLGIKGGNLRERLAGKEVALPIRSIAVLPLQNLSNDSDQEYFADGLTDALITDLAQIGSLKVISRTSTMRYKKTDKTLPEIQRELNVDGIVEGTVQRSGDRARITVQLIQATTDKHVWANSYERNLRDAFALQSEVALEVANEIRVKMTPSEQQRLLSPRPVNYNAVIAYLEGRAHLKKVQQLQFQKNLQQPTQEEFVLAVASFDRAVREDPSYTRAYLGYFEAMDSEGENHLELLAKAKDGINKAISLDDTFADAHVYMARYLSQYEWDWSGAERECKRALELSPNSAKAHEVYSDYLLSVGRRSEAENEEKLSSALDPLCTDSFIGTEGCLNFEQELKYLEETDAPGHRCFLYGGVGKELLADGKATEAMGKFEKMMVVCGYPEMQKVLARSYSEGDYRSALRAWQIGMEREIANHQPIPSLWMAFIYSALDDRDNAFRWLDKALENRSWCILYLKDDPIWDPIRSDPRFRDILHRVGLPQ